MITVTLTGLGLAQLRPIFQYLDGNQNVLERAQCLRHRELTRTRTAQKCCRELDGVRRKMIGKASPHRNNTLFAEHSESHTLDQEDFHLRTQQKKDHPHPLPHLFLRTTCFVEMKIQVGAVGLCRGWEKFGLIKEEVAHPPAQPPTPLPLPFPNWHVFFFCANLFNSFPVF